MSVNYVQKLYHVAITVDNIDEAMKFYCDVLGLHTLGSLRGEESDGALLGFPGQRIKINAEHLVGEDSDNATVIDLIEFIVPGTLEGKGPVTEMNRIGIDRLAFDVKNLDELYATLKSRDDIHFICEPLILNKPTGGFFKAITFRDPYGITMEFLESFDELPEGCTVA